MKVKYIVFLLFYAVIFMPNFSAAASLQPFIANYEFSFSGFVAGKGKLEAFLDNNTYTVEFKGKTVAPVRWFFKLNVEIKDIINIKNGYKDVYYYSSFERTHKLKRVKVYFDNRTEAIVIYQKNNDRKKYILSSNNGIFSPLSVYLFFVTHRIKLGKTYFKDIVVSKKLYRVKIVPLEKCIINLDPLGRERGKRKALKVELSFFKLSKNGRLTKKKEIKKLIAWISLAPPRVPLLIHMWHFIGVFEAKLVDIKNY